MAGTYLNCQTFECGLFWRQGHHNGHSMWYRNAYHSEASGFTSFSSLRFTFSFQCVSTCFDFRQFNLNNLDYIIFVLLRNISNFVTI